MLDADTEIRKRKSVSVLDRYGSIYGNRTDYFRAVPLLTDKEVFNKQMSAILDFTNRSIDGLVGSSATGSPHTTLQSIQTINDKTNKHLTFLLEVLQSIIYNDRSHSQWSQYLDRQLFNFMIVVRFGAIPFLLMPVMFIVLLGNSKNCIYLGLHESLSSELLARPSLIRTF